MEKNLQQQSANIIKIVLFGPESTGKTTLSRQLARHYNTVWVPEYAREYLQNKWNNTRKTCEKADFIPIAVGQMKLENKLANKADKILICDTDLLETKVYYEQFYDVEASKELTVAAKNNTYDLYLLTYIDTPWEADDLRDKPQKRIEMFAAFENELKENKKPYILLKGGKLERFQKAINAIDEIISKKGNLFSFSNTLSDLDMHFLHQNNLGADWQEY